MGFEGRLVRESSLWMQDIEFDVASCDDAVQQVGRKYVQTLCDISQTYQEPNDNDDIDVAMPEIEDYSTIHV